MLKSQPQFREQNQIKHFPTEQSVFIALLAEYVKKENELSGYPEMEELLRKMQALEEKVRVVCCIYVYMCMRV